MSRVQDLFDLTDRVAVLTGVGSGIGKATAALLSRGGRHDRRRRHRRGRRAGDRRRDQGRRRHRDRAPRRRHQARRRRRARRPRRVRARPGRHHRQHRRRPAQQARRRVHRRGVRAHPRDQPEERLLRMPGRDPPHDPAGLGQHRQHRVGCDRHARADARVLRHDEGRGHDAHQDARDRSRAARHPRERDRARA